MRKSWSSVVVVGAITLAACGGGEDAATAPGAASGAAAPAQESSHELGTHDPGVTVVGEGRVSAAPDTARLVVGVEVARPDARTALDDANAAMTAVLDALRAQDVSGDDLQTRDLSLRERRDRPRDGAPEVTGYVATNSVEVTVRELERVGELVGAAVDAGGDAARVQRLHFVVEDDRALLEEARRLAFEDAERRAQQYADLAGRDLGELTALSEVLPSGPGPVLEDAGRASAPPVEPGQQETTVRIRATWELG